MVRHLAVRSALGLTANLTLGTLDREGPARVTTLAVAANIGQPAMTELVQRLERQSLVTRVDDSGDGRAALVTVTNAGRALLDDQRRDRRDRMAEMLAALSADEEVTLTLAMHVALPRHPATHRRRSKVPHADKRRHPDQPVADVKPGTADRRPPVQIASHIMRDANTTQELSMTVTTPIATRFNRLTALAAKEGVSQPSMTQLIQRLARVAS